MKLELIQYNYQAINSCYILRDFLDDLSYLNLLKDKLKNLTVNDEMQHKTNVKANMTAWQKLLEVEEFQFLHQKILQTICMCYQLRTPHPHHPVTFEMTSSWGMLHKQNDKTATHCHANVNFAAAFYLQVPHSTIFHLPDFDGKIELEDNLLVFFPGATKHSVDPFIGDGERLSMACNINFFQNPK